MNLIDVINDIKKDISKLERKRDEELNRISEKYDKKINDLKVALDVNINMNTYCLRCDGRGFYMQLDCAGIESNQEKCDYCNGTGRQKVK